MSTCQSAREIFAWEEKREYRPKTRDAGLKSSIPPKVEQGVKRTSFYAKQSSFRLLESGDHSKPSQVTDREVDYRYTKRNVTADVVLESVLLPCLGVMMVIDSDLTKVRRVD